MKKSKIFKGILLSITMLLLVGLAKADEIERTLYDGDFDVAKNALLTIDHKFGELKCKNWDQNKISVKVTATIKTGNREKANKILDKIHIDVEGNKTGVSIETDFNEKMLSRDKSELTIDIEIMMPRDVRLDIDHQFGNAYIEEAEGDSQISSQYGSIDIGALKSENNKFEVQFGEARIDFINRGNIEVSYSTCNIDESLDLSVEADYSTFSIDRIDNLDIENEGGQVEVGRVATLDLSSKFSDFKVDDVRQILIADTEYGSLRVRNIHKAFTQVQVENSFGSVSLGFASDASFRFEAELEFCDIDYPSGKFNFSQKIINSFEKYYKGTAGENGKGSEVSIESSYGSVTIKM